MKLITIQRIGDEERRASADLSWNDEEEKEEINNENRQADTKDLTSSSKVLRVLGPNLTDASYLWERLLGNNQISFEFWNGHKEE